MSAKLAATAAIAQLFEGHLAALVQHPMLLQALARVLREDYKKSRELCLNLLSVFLIMSHQVMCHPALVQVATSRRCMSSPAHVNAWSERGDGASCIDG